MKKTRLVSCLLGAVSIALLSSCNIFSAFEGKSGDQAFLDQGMQALHDGDYNKAIDFFSQITDSTVKSKKLCTAYLGRAGFSLNSLLNTIEQSDGSMLGALANEIEPWTSQEGEDAATARTHCAAYYAADPNSDSGALLGTLGYLVDCAARMAKSDLLRGDNEADASCDTPGNQNGVISSVDIDTDNTGNNGVMCSADVDQCSVDFDAFDGDPGDIDLAAAGFSGLNDAVTAMGLAGGTTTAVRAIIRGSCATR